MKKPIFEIKIDSINDQVQFLQNYLNNCVDNEVWLFEFFELDKLQYKILTECKKTKLLKKQISKKYEDNKLKFEEVKQELFKKLEQNYNLIIGEFAQIFDVNYDGTQKYELFLGVCPVCPRFLDWFCFNLCVTDSCDENFETVLHELTHFFWFDLFKKEFPQIEKSEYETPHLPWLISEIVVDAVLRNSKFSKFLVYKPSYNYFYEIEIEGENLMEKINKMYVKSTNITTFMHKVFDFISKNQEIIK